MLLKSDTEEKYELGHIKELDGLKAIFIMIVVWHHFWLQSWLEPVVGGFSLDWLVRGGNLFIDATILLSAFCLFLPYARAKVYGEEIPNTREFYINRIAKIVPSYVFALIIMLLFVLLPNKEYQSVSFAVKDIISHLFFVHNLIPEVKNYTPLYGNLWTVGIGMQLYFIFPFIAKSFLKKPILTYFCLVFIGLFSCFLISSNFENINQAYWVNHILTFFSVFANGMLRSIFVCYFY